MAKFKMLVLLLFATNLYGAETDQYLVWDIELKDSLKTVEAYLNEKIKMAIQRGNSDKKDYSCQEMTLKAFNWNGRTAQFLSQIEGDIYNHPDIERYPQIASSERGVVESSIYRDVDIFKLKVFGININLNNIYFGVDKLGHFISTGRDYYRTYRRWLKLTRSPKFAIKKAIRRGIFSERTYYGLTISGVFSYADLEANYQGLLFAQSFCEGDVTVLKDFNLKSLGKKRDILVWTPPNYDDFPEKEFPVIYFHDGQNAFDPDLASFGNEWGLDETISEMIKRKEIDGFIVVGIPCHSRDRNSEYNYFLEGRTYVDAIVHDLRPFINKSFKTKQGRSHTFTMGSSMGALISFSMVLQYPEIFGKGAGLSFPAFAHDDFIYRAVEQFPVRKDIQFYFDHGGLGQDQNYKNPMDKFLRQLIDYGMDKKQFHYKIFPYDGHNEIDWGRRVNGPLHWF